MSRDTRHPDERLKAAKKYCYDRFRKAGVQLPTRLMVWKITDNLNGRATRVRCVESGELKSVGIEIPRNIFGDADNEYLKYYALHEGAHAAQILHYEDISERPHDKYFYRIFLKVCPEKFWCFEREYKKSMDRFLHQRDISID